ncbi:MAG: hypothetical protein MJZ76_04595 [Bacteroidales bacterium]|nr:hypothetical protein [Bacteroidales bacterium]
MKNYKKVELVAKNAPRGSYAAGCPSKDRNQISMLGRLMCQENNNCSNCERTA